MNILSNVLIFGYKSLSFEPIVPAWSLDIEAQFYLLAPVLVIFMRRSLWWLSACALVSVGAYRFDDTISVAPYLVFFAIGAAAASAKWKPNLRLAYGALAVTFAIILACVFSPFSGVLLGGTHHGPLLAFNGAANVALALLMAPWAIYTVGWKDTRFDGILGDLSYIVYLLHWPILESIDTGNGSYLHRGLMIFGVFGITLLGSVLIWATFDHPINRLRAKWVTGRLAGSKLSEDMDQSIHAANR